MVSALDESGETKEYTMRRTDKERMRWYIDHRIEYLTNQLESYKRKLEQAVEGASFNYDVLKSYLEIRGRIRELRNLQDHMETW
ncbi:hypothetical protein [Alicyclobacillus contaminans]|uniref:hypothetical protein n=1 Tax=Alicyclobacillus contaminans TaxID=392016 RepID=UPI00041AC36C|nr:hypothetical protein [Alicyclobacillus contaminans]